MMYLIFTIVAVLMLLVALLVYFLRDAYFDLLEVIHERDEVRKQRNELNKQLGEFAEKLEIQSGELIALRAFRAQAEAIADRYAPIKPFNLEPNIKPERLNVSYIPEQRTLIPLSERTLFP